MVDPLTTAAVGWGFSAAGWLISPVLTRFLNKCFDTLGIDPQFQSRKQILLAKLERLETTLLPQLLILTDVAQRSPHRRFLNEWLQKLKSAFYEAEDVLGLVEYLRLEKEVNSLFPSTSKFNLKKLKGKLPKFSSEKKNLIKSLENLEKIINEALQEFVPLLNLPSSSGSKSPYSSRETHSIPPTQVIGRDKDRDFIVKFLRESTSDATSYSVIGISGMGGSGKTTLAQYVCAHEKAAKYFDPIMWVYVSEKFCVLDIMRKIWESVSNTSCPNFVNLDVLTSQVAGVLSGRRYLLVLDDVWYDEGEISEGELEKLFAPLSAGKVGSKILVTTRNKVAARALGAVDLIQLPELTNEAFLLLFMNHALSGARVNDENKLREIGEKIVQKLCRLPLAAIAVAGQLRRRKDPEFWLTMLNKSFVKDMNDIFEVLHLSYQHLPHALQRCFAFCSLFPKGHQFKHDHLVNLWIAEGFIETEDSNEHVKDIANQYILELISSSFFQIVECNSKLYSMHDLMHDLAQYASDGDCFRIESGEILEIPAHTRHIFVVDHLFRGYMEKICELKYLRTIIASRSYSKTSFLQGVDLDALSTKLRKLYLLEIEGLVVESLPKSGVHLRNLRYLKIETNEEVAVLNRLYQLRTLCINSQIPDVGRLILLQNLKEFHVRMEMGFELKQLEHLKDLSGSLSIYGLEDVINSGEAYRAKLSDKKGLHKLLLDYKSGYYQRPCNIDVEIIDVEIIDAEILGILCPPPQIKELTINGYRGEVLPYWISENNDNIIHLEHLKLANCRGLVTVYGISALRNLVSLTISFLPLLERWALPLNITQLEISHCLSLALVLKDDLEIIMSTKSTRISQIVTFMESSLRKEVDCFVDFQFKRVVEMMESSGDYTDIETYSTISKDLKKCLEKRFDLICQLKIIYTEPYQLLPHKLEKLSIKTCFITDKFLEKSLCCAYLTHLRLEDIITITCIPKEVLQSQIRLLNLCIVGCLLLSSIGGWDTHSTLEEFYISNCPNLILEASLVDESCSSSWLISSSVLKYVKLESCMPSDDILQGLVSLERLHVWDCPTIKNPCIGHLKTLSHLELQNCPNLASLRGLSELNNLEHLEVLFGCEELECSSDADKLPPLLEELRISRWSLLEQLVSRDRFSSLVSLQLHYAQQENFSPEECEVFQYFSSLSEIRFYRCKMHSLPNLLCLGSLRYLNICCCENLSSLPEIPQSVEWIEIYRCNEELIRSCKDPNHPNWHKKFQDEVSIVLEKKKEENKR